VRPPSRPLNYPPSPPEPVVEILHGHEIIDPYRWLEDDAAPETQDWTRQQNRLTEDYLSAIAARAAIRTRLTALLTIGAISVPTPVKGRYFYQLREGGQNQPVLRYRLGLAGEDRVLVDPNALNTLGTTALDWFFPSADGALLAYGLSEDGSEDSVLHLMDVESGSLLSDRIPQTRAADLAWRQDGSGFYYTRYPAPGEVPGGDEHYHRSIYFHRVGDDPRSDELIFRPEEKEHWPGVSLSPDDRWLVVSVARTFDQTDIYLKNLEQDGPLEVVVRDLPASFDATVVRERLYLRTNLDAPNFRIVTADPSTPAREHWREIVPARDDAVLEGMGITRGHIVLNYLERATSRIRIADLDGQVVRDLQLPGIGSVFGIGIEWDSPELLYGFSSFTVAPSIYHVTLPAGIPELWRRIETDLNLSQFVVDQVTYASKDGTNVTMFIVRPDRLERDGRCPLYLTGYGGFNISMLPGFSRSMLLWLEAGGVIAIPNLRGGGEYGESWHQAGMQARKQNTFDDFIAAAEYLIRERYTSPERLAVAGGSNGGLLMGAVLTQSPELFRAVIIQVPLLDMLRYHRFLIARLWIPEYGSPDKVEEFPWLQAYSPYHHVKEGVPYPAVLLATAESDTRVHPMHARKMTARLQAATASNHPILLRLETRAGHGAGKPVSKLIDELTDSWTFVFQELGIGNPDPP
jgi:prolyl oligopeptidase